MATCSFFTDMVIDTPEAMERLIAAIDEAERRGPLEIHAQGVTEDEELVRRAVERARQRRPDSDAVRAKHPLVRAVCA